MNDLESDSAGIVVIATATNATRAPAGPFIELVLGQSAPGLLDE